MNLIYFCKNVVNEQACVSCTNDLFSPSFSLSSDIVKIVLKEYKNVFQEIMNRAQQRFEQVFGFKVVEIDPKNHVYILINKLEPAEEAQRT